jgi:hypothetical protein
MLGNRKIICDTQCEIYPEIKHLVDDTFWDFNQHEPVANSFTIFARQTVSRNYPKIKELASAGFFLPVLANPSEGSQIQKLQYQRMELLELITQKKILLVGCGEMEPELNCLVYDCYLNRVIGYEQNIEQGQRIHEIYSKKNKPYKFLFLNGRTRPHRKYMIEKLRDAGLLEHALWTNLDITPVYHHTYKTDLLDRESTIHLLPEQYEVDQYRTNVQNQFVQPFVKHELFNSQWGDVYIRAEPYIDTYFSLVSETVCDYPYSLRSEKIYKPLTMGHPFVAIANRGFYRDLRNAGFQTYHNLIDESFDLIDNNQDRLDQIAKLVNDLCSSNLDEFLVAAQSISKYNQLHMAELGPRIFQEFPDRFCQFLQQYK